MASLIDELISVLGAENEEYRELTKISSEKTTVIIREDLDRLREITAKEQEHAGTLINLEKKREAIPKAPPESTFKSISKSISKNEKSLKSYLIKDIIVC